MEENIVIMVPFRGGEKQVNLQWQSMGYTHRFLANIDGIDVYFEPDEERNYRAILPSEPAGAYVKIHAELIQGIATLLQETLS